MTAWASDATNVNKRSGVGAEAAMVGSDSNSDPGVVTTAPGDSDSDSDSDFATLGKTIFYCGMKICWWRPGDNTKQYERQ